MKGQKKQDEWMSKLQDLITNSKFGREIDSYLNRILKYDNIPRKKAKFLNFVKASIVKDDRVGEKLWLIIEQAIKPVQQQAQKADIENKATNVKEDKLNNDKSNAKEKSIAIINNNDDKNDLKRKIEDDQNLVENKKAKGVQSDLNESTVGESSLNQVIENLIERSKETQTIINPSKLAKKILKRKDNQQMQLKKFKKLIRRLGPFTEFKELPINEFYFKFIEKLSEKDYFQINKETILYKN